MDDCDAPVSLQIYHRKEELATARELLLAMEAVDGLSKTASVSDRTEAGIGFARKRSVKSIWINERS